MRSARASDVGLFALLAAFWGGSFVAIKFAVAVLPSGFAATLRVGVALACLTALFKKEGRDLRADFATRRRMWAAGVFAQGLPFALLFWGERRIAPGLAGIVNGTVPLWTFALGAIAGRERDLAPRRLGGLLLGFAGVAVICAPVLAFGGTRDEALGTAAVFGMAVSYGLGTLLTRAILSGEAKADFRANVYHQHCASLVFLAAWSLTTEPWPPVRLLASSPAALVSVLYLGVCSTAAAFLIYFHLIREWGAVRASAVTYLVPILALFWDWVFFGGRPSVFETAGVAAVLGGVVLLNG